MLKVVELEVCDWIDWDEGRDFPAPEPEGDSDDQEEVPEDDGE
jgi:hypothetical protein